MDSDGERPVQMGDRIVRALDNPWVVLALVFFVFAILGIPLIWISKGFSTWAKVALSVVVTLYTAALLWGFWLIMQWSYQRVIEAL